jgi:hypothetical protein
MKNLSDNKIKKSPSMGLFLSLLRSNKLSELENIDKQRLPHLKGNLNNNFRKK